MVSRHKVSFKIVGLVLVLVLFLVLASQVLVNITGTDPRRT